MAIGRPRTCEIGRVPEREITEFDIASHCSSRRNGGSAIINLGFRVQHEIQATHGCRAALENICDPSQRNHRAHQKSKISTESDEDTKRYLDVEKLNAVW